MDIWDEVDRSLRDGDPQAALDRLLSASPEAHRLRYAESLSLALLQMRQYEQSAHAAKEALASGLESKRLHDVLSRALTNLGLVHEAQAQAALGSGDPDMLASEAWSALWRGDFQRAEKLAGRALESTPSQTAIGILWAARAFQGQEGAFERLLDLWRNDGLPVAFNAIVLYAERSGKLPEIEPIVEQAVRWPKADTQFFYWIAHYYLRSGRPEKALAALEEAPERIRTLPRMDLLRGMALGAQGKSREALPLLQRAFEDQPAGVEEARYYFSALLKSGRWITLARAIQAAVRSKMRLLPRRKPR